MLCMNIGERKFVFLFAYSVQAPVNLTLPALNEKQMLHLLPSKNRIIYNFHYPTRAPYVLIFPGVIAEMLILQVISRNHLTRYWETENCFRKSIFKFEFMRHKTILLTFLHNQNESEVYIITISESFPFGQVYCLHIMNDTSLH